MTVARNLTGVVASLTICTLLLFLLLSLSDSIYLLIRTLAVRTTLSPLMRRVLAIERWIQHLVVEPELLAALILGYLGRTICPQCVENGVFSGV